MPRLRPSPKAEVGLEEVTFGTSSEGANESSKPADPGYGFFPSKTAFPSAKREPKLRPTVAAAAFEEVEDDEVAGFSPVSCRMIGAMLAGFGGAEGTAFEGVLDAVDAAGGRADPLVGLPLRMGVTPSFSAATSAFLLSSSLSEDRMRSMPVAGDDTRPVAADVLDIFDAWMRAVSSNAGLPIAGFNEFGTPRPWIVVCEDTTDGNAWNCFPWAACCA